MSRKSTNVRKGRKATPAQDTASSFVMPVNNDKTHIANLSQKERANEIAVLLRAKNDASNVDVKKRIRRALRRRDYYISREGNRVENVKVTTRAK